MEAFIILAALWGGIFLVYGLLLAAGVVEAPCACDGCRAARRDITRGW